MDQWLALLILGDLDPYTPPITPRVSLPTRSTKSHQSPKGICAVRQRYGEDTTCLDALELAPEPIATIACYPSSILHGIPPYDRAA